MAVARQVRVAKGELSAEDARKNDRFMVFGGWFVMAWGLFVLIMWATGHWALSDEKERAEPAARANALAGAAISHGLPALDRALSFEESGSPAAARVSPLTLAKKMFPKTLYPSKTKFAVMLLGALAFVAVGVLALRSGVRAMWLPILFFGLCSLVFATTLLPQASFLRLEKEGFTFVSLFRRSTVKWRDVQAFHPGKLISNSMVFFDYVIPGAPHPTARKMSVDLCGHEAALPDTYGLSAEELAALMNAAKAYAEKG
jgi:hypothetical protein